MYNNIDDGGDDDDDNNTIIVVARYGAFVAFLAKGAFCVSYCMHADAVHDGRCYQKRRKWQQPSLEGGQLSFQWPLESEHPSMTPPGLSRYMYGAADCACILWFTEFPLTRILWHRINCRPT